MPSKCLTDRLLGWFVPVIEVAPGIEHVVVRDTPAVAAKHLLGKGTAKDAELQNVFHLQPIERFATKCPPGKNRSTPLTRAIKSSAEVIVVTADK